MQEIGGDLNQVPVHPSGLFSVGLEDWESIRLPH